MNSTNQIIQDKATMQALKAKLIATGETYAKGLGEAYALGYLSSMLENMMAMYPEVRAEVQSALDVA